MIVLVICGLGRVKQQHDIPISSQHARVGILVFLAQFWMTQWLKLQNAHSGLIFCK